MPIAQAELAAGIAEIEWCVEPARSGAPSLRLARQQIHSAYDPEREAQRFAADAHTEAKRAGRDLAVLIGAGLGPVAQALRTAFGGEVLVWEPFGSLHEALSHAYLDGAPVETDFDALEAKLARRIADGRRPFLLIHPGYREICRFERRLLQRSLRRLAGLDRVLEAGEALVSRRAVEALARLPVRRTLTELAGCCDGQTAVIVASGPSLADSLETLARRRGGVVFAAVQALGSLAEAGVRVDFAVAPDPLSSTSFVNGFEPEFGALLAETAVEPELLDRWPERTVLFPLASDQLYDVAWRADQTEPIDEPFNTVSETALVLAHRLGARNFALVGVDLCGDQKGRFRARTANGGSALTYPHYFHAARYLDHTCPRLVAQGCEFWRVGDGLAVAGTETIDASTLAARLERAPRFTPPPPRRVCDPGRLKISRDLLRAAAERRVSPPRRASHPWPDFAELADRERRAACEAALRGLASYPA